MSEDRQLRGVSAPRPVLFLLFYLSGFAALVYQVLWLKELGLVFGVTAYAAAATLAVFFLGLAAGGLLWGRLAARLARPLRAYAWLELAIAASALLYFWLVDLYREIYPALFGALGERPGLFLAAKFLLAVGVLFPPACFMGGTLPVMGELMVRRANELGRTATALYAVNTLGATTGALAAGFLLPRMLGFRVSYLVAVGINLAIAGIAFLWSRRKLTVAALARPVKEAADGVPVSPRLRPHLIWVMAGASGCLTLALEVLWTRMFAQVLQNSVYTFATILTVFLLALALGSVVANWLTRRPWPPARVLSGLLVAAGIGLATVPPVFHRLNAGLGMLGEELGWGAYVLAVFSGTGVVLLVPGLLVGSVFPYLMKLAEPMMTSAGRTIGQLAAVNTVAAIFGSLIAGFVLLDWIGLWSSLRWISALYLVMALVVLPRGSRGRLIGLLPIVGLVVLFATQDPEKQAKVALDARLGEEVVHLSEGPHGTVAVIRRGDDLRLKVNNHYLLGTAESTPNLRFQSWLALSLHPQPRSVFFLGMGTGITAGGALDFPLEELVVAELNGQVVEAARAEFAPFLNGLFEDARARVLTTDGRAYLAGTRETFDVIVGDIFLTYRAGVGSLYTREHFQAVRERLAEGGIFVQWLPIFDFSEGEFGIVTRTMLEVFPQVTVWRRGFSPVYPIYALVGSEAAPLDADVLRANLGRLADQGDSSPDLWFQSIPLAAYAGNPSAVPERYQQFAASTDDRQPLEYSAPITERNSKGSRTSRTLAWGQLPGFCERLLHGAPMERDPYLANLEPGELSEIEAGLAFQRHAVYRRLGRERESQAARSEYQRLVAEALRVGG